MIIALLPALTLAAAETAFDTEAEMERAVYAGMRSAVAAGWKLVDVEEMDVGVAFTLVKDGVARRHVAWYVEGHAYRVEPGQVRAEPSAPGEDLVKALRGPGGLEIESTCDGFYVRSYVVERFAAGADARALVARTLAGAADLETAELEDGIAVFRLEAGGEHLQLDVSLTDAGDVADAELRRYGSARDRTIYRRRGAMARALTRTIVSSIHQDGDGIHLRTSRGRFSIDPDGTAFRERYPRPEGSCGC